MIFDAGVFIALENKSKRTLVVAIVEQLLAEGVRPRTTEAVLSQAWRNPAQQVPMRRLVNTTTVYPFGDPQAIGARCAATNTSDVVDADLAIWSEVLDDTILTTDPNDMTKLGAKFITL